MPTRIFGLCSAPWQLSTQLFPFTCAGLKVCSVKKPPLACRKRRLNNKPSRLRDGSAWDVNPLGLLFNWFGHANWCCFAAIPGRVGACPFIAQSAAGAPSPKAHSGEALRSRALHARLPVATSPAARHRNRRNLQNRCG